MKTILIVGSDKISTNALAKIQDSSDLHICIDRSTNIKRVIRLIKKGVISPLLILRMFLCELFRSRLTTTVVNQSLKSNQDLLRVIKDLNPDRVVLFRAGLILNKEIINSGPRILNIHAASVPQYGGIGSIYRALQEGAFEQSASLHLVTERIDHGEVLDEERYVLIPSLGYCENEQIAYQAASKLLLRALK